MKIRLSCKKSSQMAYVILGIVILLTVKWLYMYVTLSVLYDLDYSSQKHFGINFNPAKEIIASVIFIVEAFIVLITKRDSDFKETLMYLLFIMYYIPLNSIVSLVNASCDFMVISNLFFFLIIFFLTIHRKRKIIHIEQKIDESVEENFFDGKVRAVCFGICILFILYKLSFNGFNFSLLMSGDYVYANRITNHDKIMASEKGVLSLLITVLSNIATYAAPLYLLLSIQKKRIVGIIVAALCILSQYSIYSMKGNLLMIPVVIGICILCSKHIKIPFHKLIVYGSLLFFACITFLWIKFDRAELYMLIVRRMLYLPTWLNTMYFEFFSAHPKVLLTDEIFIIKRFLPHVYNESVLTLISKTYFAGEILSPNNGLLSEAYMQFGIFGVLLYPSLYSLVFRWADYVYKPYGRKVQVFVAFIFVSALPNIGMFRTDFVMTFFLLTFILQIISKIDFGIAAYSVKLRRTRIGWTII